MKSIVIYNAKGGVGSTLLTAAHCIVLARSGVRVVGASLDSNRDLRPFLERHQIPWFDATGELPKDADLIVLDVRSTTEIADVLRPTLWVMPMDNRTAYENAINVTPRLAGPAVWVWSNVGLPADEFGELAEGWPVPESLRSRVGFADQIIHRDSAIAAAADYLEFACPKCSGAMRQIEALVRSNAARVGLNLDDAACRPWRDIDLSAETPAEVTNYLHSRRQREHQARERLLAFFEER